MTDKALLIQALRQASSTIEQLAQGRNISVRRLLDAMREYRLLADLCEGRLEAEACAKTAEAQS